MDALEHFDYIISSAESDFFADAAEGIAKEASKKKLVYKASRSIKETLADLAKKSPLLRKNRHYKLAMLAVVSSEAGLQKEAGERFLFEKTASSYESLISTIVASSDPSLEGMFKGASSYFDAVRSIGVEVDHLDELSEKIAEDIFFSGALIELSSDSLTKEARGSLLKMVAGAKLVKPSVARAASRGRGLEYARKTRGAKAPTPHTSKPSVSPSAARGSMGASAGKEGFFTRMGKRIRGVGDKLRGADARRLGALKGWQQKRRVGALRSRAGAAATTAKKQRALKDQISRSQDIGTRTKLQTQLDALGSQRARDVGKAKGIKKDIRSVESTGKTTREAQREAAKASEAPKQWKDDVASKQRLGSKSDEVAGGKGRGTPAGPPRGGGGGGGPVPASPPKGAGSALKDAAAKDSSFSEAWKSWNEKGWSGMTGPEKRKAMTALAGGFVAQRVVLGENKVL